MVKRKTHILKDSQVIEVEEYPMVGHKGTVSRKRKEKVSDESQMRINKIRQQDKVRRKLIQYFDMSDYFITLTYRPENRPETMEEALKDWKKLYNQLARYYKRKGVTLRWVKNVERGTKGAWHIHLIIKKVDGLLEKIDQWWTKGYINYCRIGRDPRFAEMHFIKLAAYITKSEVSREKKKDGTYEKPRLKEAHCTWSKNMPLPDPKVKKLKQWRKEPWCKKGYVIVQDSLYQGEDVMGFMVRRYTMLRI